MQYLKRFNAGKRLPTLDLSKLLLESVPSSVVLLTHLERLSMARNKIGSLEYQGGDELILRRRAKLDAMVVIGAPEQAIRVSLFPLHALQFLNASSNALVHLPIDLLLLTRLTGLDISKNRLTTLYLEFGLLSTLTEMVCLDNPWRSPHAAVMARSTGEITAYLRTVHEAHSSQRLVMNRLGLQAVTTDVTLASSLTVLNLDGNEVALFSPDIAGLSRLTALHVRRNLVATLPWELVGLAGSLLHADFGENRLAELPGVVGTLSSLQTLLLDHNSLAKLPNAIGDLVWLERLSVEHNALAALPPTLPRLTGLLRLDVSHNRLRALPLGVGRMAGLQELCAAGNRLQALPESLCQCTDLHTLALSDNEVAEIPRGLSCLTNLTHLSFRANRVPAIPPALSRNVLLVTMDYDDNPIADPPQLVLREGFQAVMDYLTRMFDVTVSGHLDLRSRPAPPHTSTPTHKPTGQSPCALDPPRPASPALCLASALPHPLYPPAARLELSRRRGGGRGR
jgi:Leucine-rich repeat (LRR) protein